MGWHMLLKTPVCLCFVTGSDLYVCSHRRTRSEHVDAPLINEFPLNLECALIHTLKIGLHTLFVGEILDVKADESILNDSERPSIRKLNPPIFSTGEASYFDIGQSLGAAFSIGKEIEG